MKEIWIIRHGEDETDLKVGGWTDTMLSKRGVQQAIATGKRLAGYVGSRPFCYYCSDLKRAAETAAWIGEAIGKKPVETAGLREMNNGIAANRTAEEAKQLALPMTTPVLEWVPYPGAESWLMLQARIALEMEKLEQQSYCDTVVIVTHGNAAIAMIHWWLGIPEALFTPISYEIEHGSITKLASNEWGEKTISKLNETAHLEKENNST